MQLDNISRQLGHFLYDFGNGSSGGGNPPAILHQFSLASYTVDKLTGSVGLGGSIWAIPSGYHGTDAFMAVQINFFVEHINAQEAYGWRIYRIVLDDGEQFNYNAHADTLKELCWKELQR